MAESKENDFHTLCELSDSTEALSLVSHLSSHGIEVIQKNENLGGYQPYGGITKIQVASTDLSRAKGLFDDFQAASRNWPQSVPASDRHPKSEDRARAMLSKPLKWIKLLFVLLAGMAIGFQLAKSQRSSNQVEVAPVTTEHLNKDGGPDR